MTEYTLNENKDCGKKIIKRAHRISDRTFVVIDDTLLKRLSLNEVDNAWFEQELTGDGILLKIVKTDVAISRSLE
jgi:hypothetical protein